MNLFKFKEPYPDAGRESYRRYVYEVSYCLAAVGGRAVMISFNARTMLGSQ